MPREKDPYEDLLDLASWGDDWFEAKAESFGLKAGIQFLIVAAGVAAITCVVVQHFFIAFAVSTLTAYGAWRFNRKLPEVFVKFDRRAGGVSVRWGEQKIFKRLDSLLFEVCKVSIPKTSNYYVVVRLHGKILGRPSIQLMLDTKDLEMAYALAVFLQEYVRNDQVTGGTPSAPVKPHTPISDREARLAFTIAGVAVAIVFLLVWILSKIE